jgi:hypothetical protein
MFDIEFFHKILRGLKGMHDTASRSARYKWGNAGASILRSLTVGMEGRKVKWKDAKRTAVRENTGTQS